MDLPFELRRRFRRRIRLLVIFWFQKVYTRIYLERIYTVLPSLPFFLPSSPEKNSQLVEFVLERVTKRERERVTGCKSFGDEEETKWGSTVFFFWMRETEKCVCCSFVLSLSLPLLSSFRRVNTCQRSFFFLDDASSSFVRESRFSILSLSLSLCVLLNIRMVIFFFLMYGFIFLWEM